MLKSDYFDRFCEKKDRFLKKIYLRKKIFAIDFTKRRYLRSIFRKGDIFERRFLRKKIFAINFFEKVLAIDFSKEDICDRFYEMKVFAIDFAKRRYF